jgi:hypothetical protein
VSAATEVQGSQLRRFKKSLELTLISQPSTGNKFFDRTGNALVITDLDAKFEIKKNLGSSPNSCEVTVINLSKESRGRLEHKPVYAILRAGYDGVLKPLFAGNVTYARSDIKSPDWITKIQIADGGRAYAHGRMNKSYAAPIKLRQVIQDAAISFGLDIPSDLLEVPEFNQPLATGLVASGLTRDVLTRGLARYGYGWSVQDGRLQILKTGEVNPRAAWLIDVEAGMIGSPEGSVPHKPAGVSELAVDVQLFPEIVPGDMIQVNSRSYHNGIFRVNDINHVGDTAGSDWKTSIKATPLGQNPPKRGKKR